MARDRLCLNEEEEKGPPVSCCDKADSDRFHHQSWLEGLVSRAMVIGPMGEQSDDRKTPAAGADTAWAIMGLLFSGLLTWGGVGWLVDRWLGTSFMLPICLLVGAAGGLYLVAKRYGQM